ncbi:MAG: sigma-70 family RNA polymerase sigma factor [Planctomycetes bacterium]|nr:sigma-70 family RNA polymerase sigma factor [Planctomycetota bacterium]
MDDQQLLQDYAKNHSEAAFAKLVERHIDLVHTAALRQVHDHDLAEDVTQAVFLLLAQRAKNLNRSNSLKGTSLPGWLFITTRYTAANALKQRRRRMQYEKEAALASTEITEGESLWERITPHLDIAITSLSTKERDAVLLHYFEDKPVREVAASLSVSEDAVKKRLSVAMQKLRNVLRRKGVVIPVAMLATLLPSKAVLAAPLSLAALATTTALTTSGLAIATAASAAGVTSATGAISTPSILAKGAARMMMLAKLKTAAIVTVAAVAVGAAAAPVVVEAMADGREVITEVNMQKVNSSDNLTEVEDSPPARIYIGMSSDQFGDIVNVSPGDIQMIGAGFWWDFNIRLVDGEDLYFHRQDALIYVARDNSEPKLIGVVLSKAEDLEVLRKVLQEEQGPLALWCNCPVLKGVLKIPQINKVNMLQIGFDSKIWDLTPLAKMPNLTSVVLSHVSELQKISPLTKLKNLRSLRINFCESIDDFAPLADLTNLRFLDLSYTNITDLSPLKSLKHLQKLGLYLGNPINIEPLIALPQLEYFKSNAAYINDLPLLKEMPALQKLELRKLKEGQIPLLRELTNLQELHLDNIDFDDLSLLSGVTNLQSLSKYHAKVITNVASLEEFTGLKSLRLIFPPMTEITPQENITPAEEFIALKRLTKLDSLQLNDASLTDFTVLRDLTNLKWLDLCSGRNVSSLNGLENLTEMRYFRISDAKIPDLTPLQKMTKLWFLAIFASEVDDLSPLGELTNLRYLSFHNDFLDEIEALQNLVNLETIKLDISGIEDLSPLYNLKKLQTAEFKCTRTVDLSPLNNLSRIKNITLHLTGNEISNLECLKDVQELDNIKSLQIRYSKVRDFTPLQGFTQVQYLDLDGNEFIRDLSPLSTMTALRGLYLSWCPPYGRGNPEILIEDLTVLAKLPHFYYLRLFDTEVDERQVWDLKAAIPELMVYPKKLLENMPANYKPNPAAQGHPIEIF